MMKRSYLTGVLMIVVMLMCSVSFASEAPVPGQFAFEPVAMDTGQPVTVAASDALEHSDSVNTGSNSAIDTDSKPCRISSPCVVRVACNTGKKSVVNYYAMTTRSVLTPSKVPIVT